MVTVWLTRHNNNPSWQSEKRATMVEAVMVPLKDARRLSRAGSCGSGSDYELETDGELDTLDYRIQAVDPVDGSRKISLWHDVSLVHLDPESGKETDFHNFVCEIPKFSR
jgi:inorganic pyrophosphatase